MTTAFYSGLIKFSENIDGKPTAIIGVKDPLQTQWVSAKGPSSATLDSVELTVAQIDNQLENAELHPNDRLTLTSIAGLLPLPPKR